MNTSANIAQKRKWMFQVILLILIFLLLALGIWLYYDLQIRQIQTPYSYPGTKKV